MGSTNRRRRALLAAAAAAGLGGTAAALHLRGRHAYQAPQLAPAVTEAARRERRPNILLILSDQERHWLDLPPTLDRPALDWLRERGTSFTNHHAHTTPCSPSRSTIYFGQHTQLTGMTANLEAPPTFPALQPLASIGHLLRAQGYATAYKGKWHLSPVAHDPGLVYGRYPSTADALEPFGFSDFNLDGDPHGSTWTGYRYDAQTASAAARWLGTRGKALKGRQPWFLAVNFVNPHDVMFFSSGAGQERSRLRPNLLSPLAQPPVDPLYDKPWDDVPLPASLQADRLDTKPWVQHSYVELCNWLYGRIDRDDEAAWRAYQSYYFNCIRDMDRHAHRVLQALDRLGLAGDTIVVFSSDHGEMAGAHGLRQKGPHAYKENIRLPLVVCHPDVRGGSSSSALSSCIDLVPTLLGFAGVQAQARAEHYPWLKGVDLGAVVASPGARTERDRRGILLNYSVPLYMDPQFLRWSIESDAPNTTLAALKVAMTRGQLMPSFDHPAFFRGTYDGRYKFVRYFKPSDHHRPADWDALRTRNELELYDTRDDPDELRNLAADPEAHRDLLMRLSDRTNALVDAEVGVDRGQELPGPGWWYSRA